MPRLLAVSPHFPPLNAPDMQRLRMSLPHFVRAGWQITVLAVDDPTPIPPVEPELLDTVPPEVEVVRTACFSRRWTRFLGIGNIGWRALPFLHAAGRRLLRARRYDAVYFSTTQFAVLPLARRWKREFGVPYVVDIQDPWVSDYYQRPGATPPGGWKYFIARRLAQRQEGPTLREAAHVISVSQDYLDSFARRYAWWEPRRGSVVTFGVPDGDIAIARKTLRQSPRAGGAARIAYVGRLGEDMRPALELLFAGLAIWSRAGGDFELSFIGTSYAPTGVAKPMTAPLAARHGIADRVREQPARIGYLDSLRCMLEADIVLLLGSEDTAYSPSKIYPALASGRPVIAVVPSGSVLHGLLDQLGGVAIAPFDLKNPALALDALTANLASFDSGSRILRSWPASSGEIALKYSSSVIAARQIQILASTFGPQR